LTALTALELWVFPQLGFKVGLASLRMFRLLKLLYKSSTFSALMDVISSSFPEAAATVLINVVVIFVFAGMYIFQMSPPLTTEFVNFNPPIPQIIFNFSMRKSTCVYFGGPKDLSQ
jgi:hypothetical protein